MDIPRELLIEAEDFADMHYSESRGDVALACMIGYINGNLRAKGKDTIDVIDKGIAETAERMKYCKH